LIDFMKKQGYLKGTIEKWYIDHHLCVITTRLKSVKEVFPR
jgi:hypothetical protein